MSPFDFAKQFFRTNHAVFDSLCHTVGKNVLIQRRQQRRVGDDGGRLPEGPRKIFARLQVHARLAADRRVDHRQQRGRDLEDADAAQIAARRKARQVAGNAAAERDDGVAAGQPRGSEVLQQQRKGAERLGWLAGREGEAAHGAVRLEKPADQIAVKRFDVAVGDQAEASAPGEPGERGGEDIFPDEDVVGFRRVYGERFQSRSSFLCRL